MQKKNSKNVDLAAAKQSPIPTACRAWQFPAVPTAADSMLSARQVEVRIPMKQLL